MSPSLSWSSLTVNTSFLWPGSWSLLIPSLHPMYSVPSVLQYSCHFEFELSNKLQRTLGAYQQFAQRSILDILPISMPGFPFLSFASVSLLSPLLSLPHLYLLLLLTLAGAETWEVHRRKVSTCWIFKLLVALLLITFQDDLPPTKIYSIYKYQTCILQCAKMCVSPWFAWQCWKRSLVHR